MNKIIKIMMVMLIGFWVQTVYATVIETDTIIYSNKVTFSGSVDVVKGPINVSPGLYTPLFYNGFTNSIFNEAPTNTFLIDINTNSATILRGKLFNNDTEAVSRTFALSFYHNSDYANTNLFWLANATLVNSALVGTFNIGSTTAIVTDATGYYTNDLVYFITTAEEARITHITNNTLYFTSALVQNHSTGEFLSRVAEFGGFTIWNNNGTSKIYGKMSTDADVSYTNRIVIKYRD